LKGGSKAPVAGVVVTILAKSTGNGASARALVEGSPQLVDLKRISIFFSRLTIGLTVSNEG
jgi:hypothetical protein